MAFAGCRSSVWLRERIPTPGSARTGPETSCPKDQDSLFRPGSALLLLGEDAAARRQLAFVTNCSRSELMRLSMACGSSNNPAEMSALS